MAFPIKDTINQLTDLSFAEIKWLIKHLFKAPGIWKLSKEAREISNSLLDDPHFDGDYAGGQIDTFRHILWMALITQKYNAKIARSLGLAHEKSNKNDFLKGKLEEKYLPDAASMFMDLMNNELGINLALSHPNISKESLIEEVKKIVLEGKGWKIKKNSEGHFVNEHNQIIPPTFWKGKWNNPKVIVPSDCCVERKVFSKTNKNFKDKNAKIILT